MPTISFKTKVSLAIVVFLASLVILMTFDSPGMDGLVHFRPSQAWLTAAEAVSAQAEKTCWHPLGVGVNIDLTPSSCTGSFLRRVLMILSWVAFAAMVVFAALPDRNKPQSENPAG